MSKPVNSYALTRLRNESPRFPTSVGVAGSTASSTVVSRFTPINTNPDIVPLASDDGSPGKVSSSFSKSESLSADDIEKALLEASTSKVAGSLSTVLRRARGMRTPSMGRKASSADHIFSVTGSGVPMRPLSIANQTYTLTRTQVFQAWLVSSTSVEVDAAAVFHLNDLPDYSEFTNLFDQYRIKSIEVWLIPRSNEQFTASDNPGLLASAVDYDDSSTVSRSGLLEYSNVLESNGLNGHYRKFVPAAAVPAYNGVTPGFTSVSSPWVDAAYPGVEHYGFKAAISATGSVYTFDLQFRCLLEFRNSR